MVWLRISIVPMASVPEATWLRRDSDSRNEKLLGPTRGSRRLRSSRSSESSSHVRGFKELGRGLPSIRTSWTPAPRPPIPPIPSEGLGRCALGDSVCLSSSGGLNPHTLLFLPKDPGKIPLAPRATVSEGLGRIRSRRRCRSRRGCEDCAVPCSSAQHCWSHDRSVGRESALGRGPRALR